jgi:two-component system, chemotaxis family, protein-glutamate methylesterase/glutaminase
MRDAKHKIRVLIVDDSVVMRRVLADVVSSDPELEVAGYAANGQIALNLLDQVSPDVITLDIEMPVMDGLATLKALRARRCPVPVIMFSTLTERGAEATIDSLALGATDYVTKPTDSGSYDAARERIRDALLPKIKAFCSRKTKSNLASPVAQKTPAPRHHGTGRVDVVAIGCSTGGPNALAQVLPAIPREFPVPILIVQHMPPAFTRFLAQRLSNLCSLPVEEAIAGPMLKPGEIWVAPGGFHLQARLDGALSRLQITEDPPENSCRPSVDVLFRSLAPAFSNRVLAVVLTGMGQDGLRGCELLAAAGSQIIVQDEASSVVWGMPGFVARAGLADAVLPLPEIGPRIVERVAAFRPLASRKPAVPGPAHPARLTL